MNKEIWVPIKGYEGLYEISSLGRIKKMEKSWVAGRGRVLSAKESITLGCVTSFGYYDFDLCKDGTIKKTRVHRIVANHFLSKVDGHNIINHIDGDKKNNHFENLEWSNHSKNNEHAYAMGKRKTKVTREDVVQIRKYYDESIYDTYELADMFNCSQANISNIINRKTWRHVEEDES